MKASRPPTIIDVAARAGVSKSLVSMVMRDDPGVSAVRREVVLAAAAELGYRPNRAAAILAGSRTGTIGVVIDDFRNPWYIPMLDGIRDAIGPSGLRLTLVDSTANAHLPTSPFDDLVSLRVDGIVLAAESATDIAVPERTPVVVVGIRRSAPAGVDVVASDEAAGARLVVDHLVGLGHRRIAHVTGDGGSAAARRAAAVARSAESGVALVVSGEGSTSERAGFDRTRAVLDADPDVTAVFAANDVMAMGAIAAARSAGRRVPEDLSVVGYDDTSFAGSPLVDLTTVDPHNHTVGELAARRVLAMIEATTTTTTTTATSTATATSATTASPLPEGTAPVRPTLVVRGSTARPGR